jgi:hypothetical protein
MDQAMTGRTDYPTADALRSPAPPRVRRARGLTAERLAGWGIWGLALSGVGREVLGQTQLVSFGFYTLHIVDPVVVLIFAAWGLSLRERLPNGGLMLLPTMLIASLIVLNFARGMAADSAPALLWARSNLSIAPLLMLAVTCSLSPDFERTVRRALIVSAGLLCFLAVLRHIAGPSLFMTVSINDQDINDGGRVLSVGGAFLIALAAALLLSDALRSSRGRLKSLALLVAFFVVELSTGQGTASVALVAMCGMVLLLERGPLRGVRAAAGAMVLVAVALAATLIDADTLTSMSGGTFDLAHRSGNFQTRQAIWAALEASLPQLAMFDQLFGLPAGQLPDLLVTLQDRMGNAQVSEWQKSIHSMYYGSLPVMGYLGLSAYIFLLVLLALGLIVAVLRPRAGRIVPVYPLAMCIGTAILSVSYEIRNDNLLGIFVAVWWFRFARPRRMAPTPLTRAPAMSADRAYVPPVRQSAG